MDVINVCIVAVVGMITYVTIKGYKPEFAMLIIIVLSLLCFGWMMGIFEKLQNAFGEISSYSYVAENRSFYKILFKIMGITYLCEFTSGICKDAGASSIGNQIEILGKMMVLLSGIPILISVIEAIKGFRL